MSDAAIAQEPIEPVSPAPEAAAELDAAPGEVQSPNSAIGNRGTETPAAPAAGRVLPEIQHPIGTLRQAVLDALLDSEGPRTVSQILAELPAGTSRNTAESAIKRNY